MRLKTILFVSAFLIAVPSWSQQRAERHAVLMNAKNLMVTTTQNTEYYYLVSVESNPVIHLTDGKVRIVNDEFSLSDIKSLRFRSLPRFLLDEDSTTYDKTKSVEHGLMALRRSLNVGRWNSLVLPVDLTMEQVVDAFGEGTELATPRGIRENDVTVVEFQTIDFVPGETNKSVFVREYVAGAYARSRHSPRSVDGQFHQRSAHLWSHIYDSRCEHDGYQAASRTDVLL